MWQPEGSRVWGRMDIHIYIWLSHIYICVYIYICFSPETITTLLIGYIPTQNKNLKKEREKEKDQCVSLSCKRKKV